MRIFFTILLMLNVSKVFALPPQFAYLHDISPSILQDIRYAGSHNFVGRPIKGYEKNVCILTKKTAIALANVQRELQRKHLSLKVFDCYRPIEAVNDFISWSEDDNQRMKQEFYPHITKKNLFKLGYISKQSKHSLGNTIDLTIDGIDMGTSFDFLDEKSHFSTGDISKTAMQNRAYLKFVMIKHGFLPYPKEWWHFTYLDENSSSKGFNFKVSRLYPIAKCNPNAGAICSMIIFNQALSITTKELDITI